MSIVDIHDARIRLSKLVDRAARGESFIIAKAGKPMVKVSALDAPEKPKRLGFMAGEIEVPDDFDTMGAVGNGDGGECGVKRRGMMRPMGRSLAIVLATLVALAPARMQAQSGAPDSALTASLAAVLATWLDSAATPYTMNRRVPIPVLVRVGQYPAPDQRILDAAILRGVHARRSVPTDTELHVIAVDPPALRGDTATIRVIDGWRWCANENEGAYSTVYAHVFARHGDAWRHVRGTVIGYFDPPPPPPPGRSPGGCPSFHLPPHSTSLDSARTLADTLESLEQASWVAWQKRDSAFLSRFLSADHVEMGAGGQVPRGLVLRGVASPTCVVRSFHVDRFALTRLDPRTAILTYHAAQDTRCNGTPVPSPAWVTSLYVWRDGRWQNALYQRTLEQGPGTH